MEDYFAVQMSAESHLLVNSCIRNRIFFYGTFAFDNLDLLSRLCVMPEQERTAEGMRRHLAADGAKRAASNSLSPPRKFDDASL